MSAKIGCILLTPVDHGFVGLKCAKGRGIILPGGKWEAGKETFKQTAEREFKEETGLRAEVAKLLFHGLAEDGYYVYAFLGSLQERFKEVTTAEGKSCLIHWPDLLKSHFNGYYELLQDRFNEWVRTGR